MTQAGYSGTPLVRKLGYKPGMRVHVRQAPEEYWDWVGELPEDVRILKRLTGNLDLVHLFVTRRAILERELERLKEAVFPDGMIWVSWPKKSSGVASEVTEGTVRQVALPMGLVDVKVCAVSQVWSGLKVVVRKELR